jgi:hypothetical protein
MDPLSANLSQLPDVAVQNNLGVDYVTISYRKKAIDVMYKVVHSQDLINWIDTGLVVLQEGNANVDTIVGAPLTSGKCFMRLEVIAPWN